jgi:ankyrin repeat protein
MHSLELATRYPFLPYATSHFHWHINQLPTDDPLWLLFADTAGKYSIYTLKSMWPVYRYFDGSPLEHILFSHSIPDSSALGLTRRFHEHGYDVDEKWRHSSSGATLRTCCLFAHDQFRQEAALLLLELGANPNLPENADRTNIGHALEGKAWNLYEALLRHPMTDLSARNARGETLLHHQMQFGTLDRIAELLDLIDEVDLNPQDCEGRTPLHVATMLEKEDAVRMLLARPGIRLNLVDNMGRTPLALATYWGRNKMALTLIEHTGAFPLAKEGHLSALVLAAKRDDKDMCNRLLVACQYQNLRFHHDMSGKGLLHHAAMNNWNDVIETCMRRGGRTIDIDQIDHSGRSALHYASSLGNIASCQALIDGGASLTLQDRLGRTAAQAAADAGFKDALLLLLKSGRVDANQKDSERRNLVHWAATIDCVDVMELISQMPGVKLDQKDCHGKTPIDIAFTCQCKYVGLFLASKVPHLNIYSWDLIYRAPLLSWESIYREEEVYTTPEDDLLMRNAKRQQAAHEEHKELQKQYPPELWALRTVET